MAAVENRKKKTTKPINKAGTDILFFFNYPRPIERFLEYSGQTGDRPVSEADASDFKNFLSHLALKRRVSAST